MIIGVVGVEMLDKMSSSIIEWVDEKLVDILYRAKNKGYETLLTGDNSGVEKHSVRIARNLGYSIWVVTPIYYQYPLSSLTFWADYSYIGYLADDLVVITNGQNHTRLQATMKIGRRVLLVNYLEKSEEWLKSQFKS